MSINLICTYSCKRKENIMKRKIPCNELYSYQNCFRFTKLPLLLRKQMSRDFDIPADYGPQYGEMYRDKVARAVSFVLNNKNGYKQYSRWIEFPHSPRGKRSAKRRLGVVREAMLLRAIYKRYGINGEYRSIPMFEIIKLRGDVCNPRTALSVAREFASL